MILFGLSGLLVGARPEHYAPGTDRLKSRHSQRLICIDTLTGHGVFASPVIDKAISWF